jgi:hypothetical protein
MFPAVQVPQVAVAVVEPVDSAAMAETALL